MPKLLNIKEPQPHKPLDWLMFQNFESSGVTGFLAYRYENDPNAFFHSEPNNYVIPLDRTGPKKIANNLDKQYVTFENSFKEQFETLIQHFGSIDYNDAKLRFSASLSVLLNLNPELITMELTSEGSVFYTLRKQEFTFFLQYFLYDTEDDQDEALLSVYKGQKKQPSFGGSLDETILELNRILQPHNPMEFELQLNEVPY